MHRRYYLSLLLIILSLPLVVYAQDYYADITIDVSEDGVITVSGQTNHQVLKDLYSTEYTSKEGRYWILNLTLNSTFSNILFSLNLPKGATVNYIKTPGLSRFEDTKDGLRIIGTGEDKRFSLIVQYSIDYQQYEKQRVIVPAVVFLLLSIGAILYYMRKRLRDPLYQKRYTLTGRQKEIIRHLQKVKRPMTQKELQDLTGLAKSSLSRNIESLVQREILTRQQKGMSNVISLTVPRGSGTFR